MVEKLNILVVDDKKVIGDLFDFTLGYSGHVITVVDNPNAAIQKIKSENFDVIFLDIVMPEKDGVELLEDIKSLNSKLPVVMMSGYSVEERKNRAKELGAITCLKKPFEIEDVKKAIKLATGKEA